MQKITVLLITLIILQSNVISQQITVFRDNMVKFRMKTHSLISVKTITLNKNNSRLFTINFLVNNYCLKRPEYYLYEDEKENEVHVVAQRKGSKVAAKCFINWLKDGGANSFHHKPSKLNFTVKGDLQILIHHSDNKPDMIDLDDMILAQGHAGATNNWWIAGIYCKNKSRQRIECKAHDGRKWYKEKGYNLPPVCFRRPHNHVNTIDIVDC